MRVLACLLAGLISGTTVPGAVARDENDRVAYNNKMALLSVLLDSAQQRAGRDIQTLCLLMSIGNDVTERYVATQPSRRSDSAASRRDATRPQRLSHQPSRGSCMG